LPALKTKAARTIESVPAGVGESNDIFVPLHSFQNALRFWPFIFVLMLAGSLLGFLMHRARPPVYEAVGRFLASIDFVSTGPMTQFEEDIALNAIGNLVYSDAFLEKVVARAGEQGITTSISELKEAALFERKVSDWELRLRMEDPNRAEQLANFWLAQGHAELLESHQHALLAEQHALTLRALENCLQQAAASEPVSALCSPARFAEIQASMQSVGQQYSQELIASQGLSPALRLGPPSSAHVSSRPVIFNRGQLVLAGSFLGLLLGIFLVSFGLPARWIKRN
jgi:hypothetical protein